MLIIRKQQIEAFRQAKIDRFDRQMEAVLREKIMRCREMQSNQLRELIRAGREKAERLWLYEVEDVKRFLVYVGIYGREFADTPETSWAAPVLANGAPGNERLDELDRIFTSLEGVAK